MVLSYKNLFLIDRNQPGSHRFELKSRKIFNVEQTHYFSLSTKKKFWFNIEVANIFFDKNSKKNNPVIPAVSFFFNFFKFKKKKIFFFLIPHSTIFVNLDRVFSSYLVNFVFLQKSKFYKKQKKQK